MDSKQFQECVFYLKTYGTYLAMVDFHRRHGYYMKAVQYIIDHVSWQCISCRKQTLILLAFSAVRFSKHEFE